MPPTSSASAGSLAERGIERHPSLEGVSPSLHVRLALMRSLTTPISIMRDIGRGIASGNRQTLKERFHSEQAHRNAGNRQALFVWIPKCAGTSVFAELEKRGAQKLVSVEHVRRYFRQQGIVTFGHIYAPLLVADGLVDRRFMEAAWKFAIVRNPYDRVVSLFEYLKWSRDLPPTTTFDTFCTYLADGAYEPVGRANHDGLSQLNPEVTWMKDERGHMFVDHIYKYEQLEDHWPDVWSRLGLPAPAPPLKQQNRSKRKTEGDYYTARTVDIVQKVYAEDFDRFAYDVEPYW